MPDTLHVAAAHGPFSGRYICTDIDEMMHNITTVCVDPVQNTVR
jgi:hypothetical protein